jgi:hypothetical protein
MLAKYWRLRGVNETGQTMTYDDGARIAIRLCPWKLGASGAITYGTTITEDLQFSSGETIADSGEVEGSVNDNTSNKFYGIKGYAEITHDLSTADGTFDIYLEESDDNTNWPSDQASFVVEQHMKPVCRLYVVNDAVDEDSAVNFDF